MPRTASMASDIQAFLSRKRNGATTEEIREALADVRRAPVLPHSVRSALYHHLDENGERLFTRVRRGRYALRKGS